MTGYDVADTIEDILLNPSWKDNKILHDNLKIYLKSVDKEIPEDAPVLGDSELTKLINNIILNHTDTNCIDAIGFDDLESDEEEDLVYDMLALARDSREMSKEVYAKLVDDYSSILGKYPKQEDLIDTFGPTYEYLKITKPIVAKVMTPESHPLAYEERAEGDFGYNPDWWAKLKPLTRSNWLMKFGMKGQMDAVNKSVDMNITNTVSSAVVGSGSNIVDKNISRATARLTPGSLGISAGIGAATEFVKTGDVTSGITGGAKSAIDTAVSVPKQVALTFFGNAQKPSSDPNNGPRKIAEMINTHLTGNKNGKLNSDMSKSEDFDGDNKDVNAKIQEAQKDVVANEPIKTPNENVDKNGIQTGDTANSNGLNGSNPNDKSDNNSVAQNPKPLNNNQNNQNNQNNNQNQNSGNMSVRYERLFNLWYGHDFDETSINNQPVDTSADKNKKSDNIQDDGYNSYYRQLGERVKYDLNQDKQSSSQPTTFTEKRAKIAKAKNNLKEEKIRKLELDSKLATAKENQRLAKSRLETQKTSNDITIEAENNQQKTNRLALKKLKSEHDHFWYDENSEGRKMTVAVQESRAGIGRKKVVTGIVDALNPHLFSREKGKKILAGEIGLNGETKNDKGEWIDKEGNVVDGKTFDQVLKETKDNNNKIITERRNKIKEQEQAEKLADLKRKQELSKQEALGNQEIANAVEEEKVNNEEKLAGPKAKRKRANATQETNEQVARQKAMNDEELRKKEEEYKIEEKHAENLQSIQNNPPNPNPPGNS